MTGLPPLAVTAARVVIPQAVLQNATVVCEGGRITQVLPEGASSAGLPGQHLHLADATLLPGFVDLHVHGGGGWRVGVANDLQGTATAYTDSLAEMARFMATTGVTGFLPTLSTSSAEDMTRTARQVANLVGKDLPGADVLGTHLEGPYLNISKKGAQRGEYIRPPSRAEFEPIWQASDGTIRYLTIAPEVEGATEFISWLSSLGIFVSAGHTDALASDMQRAAAAGLKGATHLFNAMRGIHHREPGVAGWSLANDDTWVEIICDGVHVHPTIIRMAIRAKGAGKVAAITDAGAFTGMPNGVYDEGYRQVTVKDGICTLEDGGLAESMSPMNRNCMVLLNEVGATWQEIALMTAYVPARILGLDDRRGSIEVGKDADLTALDARGGVLLTAVRGRVVHQG